MVGPRLIAAVLLAGWLSGCGSYALLAPDTTASYTAPDRPPAAAQSATALTTGSVPAAKADTAALNSLFARAAAGKLDDPQAKADAPDIAAPVAPPAKASDKPAEPRGRAYLFRGVAGLIYSRGMDKLAERITRTGVSASVASYLAWRGAVDQAIQDYRRKPAPITLIGHSMGGDAALGFAEALNAENIPVSLLVTYDPSRIADDVPPNVERYINIYQSDNIMGGGNVVQGSRFHGHYASYNLKDHSEIVHINIEKADRIQEQLVTKVAELAVTPADGEGDALPLRLEVPADAAVELWDSALPVQAHAGDTLKSIAAAYRVPLWALAQANAVPAREPLAEGQRIAVPRHLVPTPDRNAIPSAVSSYAPVAR